MCQVRDENKLGHKKSKHLKHKMVKCLSLQLQLIHYLTNIVHEKSHIHPAVHHPVSMASKL